jgi:RNA polymerase sigma-70 factor (ECF subfamily)
MPEKSKQEIFEELAIPYLDFIYRSAYKLCGDHYDAEDLSQETFKTAFEKFYQLKDACKVKSWLFVIMRNAFLKKIAKQKKCILVECDIEQLADYVGLIHLDTYDEFFMNFSDELQDALGQLEEKYKAPIWLFYIGKYSYQEIANMLHIPNGTVMSRIARGKMLLKSYILKSQGRLNVVTNLKLP